MILDAPFALDSHPSIDGLARERRFLPTNAQLEELMAAVEREALPETNKISQAAATTWTTYLDTVDWLCALSLDGAIARHLRVREYEVPAGEALPGPCYLELKQTTGDSRTKVRLAAPIEVLARLIDGGPGGDGGLVDSVARTVALRAIRQMLVLGRFVPCVGTSYRRRCLVSGPALRVTLDEELTFFHPVSFGPPHDNRETLAFGPPRILEVKYAGALPDWLSRACESLNETPELSKFRLGMLAVRQATSIAARALIEAPRFALDTCAATVG